MSSPTGVRVPPPRPLVPISLYALVSAIVTSRAVLAAGDVRLVAGIVTVGAASAVMLLAVARRGASGSRVSPLVAGCLAAVIAMVATSLVAWGESVRMDALACELETTPASSWEFVLTGDMGPSGTGWRGRARAVRGTDRGIVWLSTTSQMEAGARVTCVGRFAANPEDDWGTASRMQGVSGTVKVVRVLSCEQAGGPRGFLLAVRRELIEAMDPTASDSRALLAACLCGYAAPMRLTSLADELSCAGISHMAAVSGTHLALVSSCVSAVLERAGLRRGLRSAIVLAVDGLFVLFCGSPVSAVRAWAMAGAAEVSALGGRRGHQLSAVSAVGLAMVLLDPGVAGQLGFLLSALGVIGIALFGAYASFALDVLLPNPRLSRPARALRSDARRVLAISVVCQAFTLPVTASAFGSVSTLAPLVNLVATPAFAALMPLGLIFATTSWVGPLAAMSLSLCDAAARPLLLVVRWVSSLPLARVPVEVNEAVALLGLAVLSVALIAWWPRPNARAVLTAGAIAALACACALVRWRWFAPAQVRVLDVGQGDAILVRDGAASLLVDVGPDSSVAAALTRAHAIHLDAVLVTHLHDDHYGGLSSLRGVVGVDRVLFGQGASRELPEELSGPVAKLCPNEVYEVSYGDVLRVGRFSLRVVSPIGETDGMENADSVELLLEFSDGGRTLTALLTGDAERDETREAILRGDVGSVDFLKVGHHGSEVSVDEGVASMLRPVVSVASAGEGNSYGHPRQECVDLLQAADSTFLCTKDVGDVCIEPGERGPRVRCEGAKIGENTG